MAEEKITRKLTTILAADVEGYTRLMRADEEVAHIYRHGRYGSLPNSYFLRGVRAALGKS